ncbi:MAG: TolC family outer membrane protein [Pseudomonadota bacterium]
MRLVQTYLTSLSALALTAALSAAPVSAETLSETLIKAYEYHPSLNIARAQLRATDEGVAQARSGGRPRVSGRVQGSIQSADNLDGPPTDTSSFGVDGQWRIFDGGNVSAQVSSARASVDSARANLVTTEQGILIDAVTSYGDVRRDTQFVALARNNVRVISRQLSAARDRFEVGEVTRTDVAQASARLASAQSNLVANQGALERSRQAYIAAVGEAPGELAPPPPLPDLPDTLEESEVIAMRMHPSIIGAQATVAAAEFSLDAAKAGYSPTVDLTGTVEQNASALDRSENVASAGVLLEVPLYNGGALSSGVRSAIATVDQRKGELQDAARVVRQNLASAWSNFEVAAASITASRQEIRAARIAFEGVSEEARLGSRTTLDVLDAEQDLLDAQSNLVSAERDQYVAAYSLLQAMGLLTVDHLGLDVDSYDPEANFNAVQGGPYDAKRNETINRILGRF